MHYLMFWGICALTTASPGPAVLLAIRNGAQYGFKRALIAILGNITAISILAAISVAGLGVIITTSTTLFNAVKIVGGLYLIYLGYKAFTSQRQLNLTTASDLIPKKSNQALYREAFLVGFTNPKAIAFVTALFPQFIDPHQPLLTQFLFLRLIRLVF